jgi:hypothetical protein
MPRKSRRELLKELGTAGAMVAGMGLMGGSEVEASHTGLNRVHIHGRLPRIDASGAAFVVDATVFGPLENLTGAGWRAHEDPNVVAGCYQALAGSVRGEIVYLEGRVLF